MNSLYPGLVGNFFNFLVHLLALFWLVHRSHMVPIFLLIQSSCILQLVLVSFHQYVQRSGGILTWRFSFLVQLLSVLDPSLSEP